MKKSSVLVAVLGVVIGVLLCLIGQKMQQRKAMRNWEYGDWRKLSLILDHV